MEGKYCLVRKGNFEADRGRGPFPKILWGRATLVKKKSDLRRKERGKRNRREREKELGPKKKTRESGKDEQPALFYKKGDPPPKRKRFVGGNLRRGTGVTLSVSSA